MAKLKNIPLNPFQLARLLDEEQMTFFKFIMAENVYCRQCRDHCKGVTIAETVLTATNDIQAKGACNVCEGQVARIVEFGENKEFYDKAIEFRK